MDQLTIHWMLNILQLPLGTKVSPDCQDILLALLQRDPLARITFEDFFAHPFLDLEHVPSPLCFEKAVRETD